MNRNSRCVAHEENRLTIEELDLFNERVFSRCGLFFRENRRDFVSQRLRERLDKNELESFDQYYRLLCYSPQGEREFTKLLDVLTTKETSFFRNAPQFKVLEKEVFPQLAARCRGTGTITVWSAGCSTGQEPYTAAMVGLETTRRCPGVKVQVQGTDISTRALLKAKKAVYPQRELEAVPRRFRVRYVEPQLREEDTFVLKSEVRDAVNFRYHNLASQDVDLRFDVIFCRNVVIYFRRDVVAGIMQKLHGCLRDGGYLFIGHSETLNRVFDGFETVEFDEAVIYRK